MVKSGKNNFRYCYWKTKYHKSTQNSRINRMMALTPSETYFLSVLFLSPTCKTFQIRAVCTIPLSRKLVVNQDEIHWDLLSTSLLPQLFYIRQFWTAKTKIIILWKKNKQLKDCFHQKRCIENKNRYKTLRLLPTRDCFCVWDDRTKFERITIFV